MHIARMYLDRAPRVGDHVDTWSGEQWIITDAAPGSSGRKLYQLQSLDRPNWADESASVRVLRTKYNLLTDHRRTAEELTRVRHPCPTCGQFLATRGEWDRHFITPDIRLRNLGYCTKGEPA